MASFSFILTEECDWDCNYCAFPLLHLKHRLTSEIIYKHMPYIKKIIDKSKETGKPFLEIQGGEIGTIEKNVLVLFLKLLGEKVNVSTNGMFLKKGYHNDENIKPYIEEIQWHLCQYPNDQIIEDFNCDDIYINKGIVGDDVDKIIKFISINSHIMFNYVEMECDIQIKRSPSTEDYRKLYDGIRDINNVSQEAKDRIKFRVFQTESSSYKCSNFHSTVSINLAAETIVLCQRCLEINIKLSKENLISSVTNFLKDLFDSKGVGCDSCIRLCESKYSEDSIKRKLLIRKIKW